MFKYYLPESEYFQVLYRHFPVPKALPWYCCRTITTADLAYHLMKVKRNASENTGALQNWFSRFFHTLTLRKSFEDICDTSFFGRTLNFFLFLFTLCADFDKPIRAPRIHMGLSCSKKRNTPISRTVMTGLFHERVLPFESNLFMFRRLIPFRNC